MRAGFGKQQWLIWNVSNFEQFTARVQGSGHFAGINKDHPMDEACRRSLARNYLHLAARLVDDPVKEKLETKALEILERAYDPLPSELQHLVA